MWQATHVLCVPSPEPWREPRRSPAGEFNGLPSSAPGREITAAKPGSQVGQGTADEAMAGERPHGWVWLGE